MYEVAITYTNGSNVSFHAQEINIDFDPLKLIGSANRLRIVQKFTYKDIDGEDAFLYLKPNEVSGVVTARIDAGKYSLTLHDSKVYSFNSEPGLAGTSENSVHTKFDEHQNSPKADQ